MNTIDVIKRVAKATNTPVTHIGVAMGKRPNYVSAIANRGSTPQCDTVVKMLEVCGYGLYAMPIDKAPSDAMRITANDDD